MSQRTSQITQGISDMKTAAFEDWLVTHKGYEAGTAKSRASNCKRVEKFYPKGLDDLYAEGDFDRLIAEFNYSTDDETHGRPQDHQVPIKGNVRTGSATLKAALGLYKEFLDNAAHGEPDGTTPPPPIDPAPRSADWPTWAEPSAAESLHLAKVLAPYVRFLHPDIVRALVVDNEKMRTKWRDGLHARGVDPDVYLWTASPCAFAGVRRYAGSEEIARYRGHKEAGKDLPQGALRLDDNDFPKHLWSFVLRGKPFQKFGPTGYSLAHLADHKVHQNRAAEGFKLQDAAAIEGRLFGLYTCPTNTVYVPRSFLKPTDFNSSIRGLLIRRAHDLYGSFCSIVPPFMEVRPNTDPDWDIIQFVWSEPVGDMTHVAEFLEFRAKQLTALMPD